MHRLPILFVVLGVSAPALAHPGHGLDGGSTHLLHYLTEPLHVAPLALAALAIVLVARARGHIRRRG